MGARCGPRLLIVPSAYSTILAWSLASNLSATSFQSLFKRFSVKVSFLGRLRGSESPDEELFLIPRIRALPSEIHLRAIFALLGEACEGHSHSK